MNLRALAFVGALFAFFHGRTSPRFRGGEGRMTRVPSPFLVVSAGLLLWISVVVPASARTIELTIPEFSSPPGLPFVPWFVGEFAFALDRNENVVAATLAGGFGNRDGGTLHPTWVLADDQTVAFFDPTISHVQIIPFPWRFAFAEPQLGWLSDGRLEIRTSGNGGLGVHLTLTHLVVTTEVPEPSAPVLLAIGALAMLLKAKRVLL